MRNLYFKICFWKKRLKKFPKYFLNIFLKRHMTFPFEWYINFVNYFERIWREKQFMFVCYRKTRKINLLYCVTCVTFKPKNHRNDIGNIDKPGRKILTKSKGSWWTCLGDLSWNAPYMTSYPNKGHLRSRKVTTRYFPITFDWEDISTLLFFFTDVQCFA